MHGLKKGQTTKQEEEQHERKKKLMAQVEQKGEAATTWKLVTMTVDSGAAESVMPVGCCEMFPILPSEGSKQ